MQGGGIVDQNIELAAVGGDALEHGRDLRIVAVVAMQGDAFAAGRGDGGCRGANRAGQRGLALFTGATGDIDARAVAPQGGGDAETGAP